MKGNLFSRIPVDPVDLPNELFDTLAKSASVKVERIVSRGHTTPEGVRGVLRSCS